MNVGDKIKGFKFEDSEYPNIGYAEEMDDYINQEGIIESIGSHHVDIKFKDNEFWAYPLELAKDFLIK